MSDYTKLTNFAVKDGYTTGNPAKVIKGTEIDDEFNAIATAVATKVDSTDVIPVATGGTGATTASAARTALGLAIGTDVPSLTGSGASGTWSISISGNAATATSATTASTANAVSSTATGTTQTISDDSNKLSTTQFVKDAAIGWGQSWQDVSGSRVAGTTYTNSTGKPIQVCIGAGDDNQSSFIIVDTINTARFGYRNTACVIVPPGSTYKIDSGITFSLWSELR